MVIKEQLVKIHVLLKYPEDSEDVFRKYLWVKPNKDCSIMIGLYEKEPITEIEGDRVYKFGKELLLSNSRKLDYNFIPHKIDFHVKTGDVVIAAKNISDDKLRLGRFTGARDKFFNYNDRPNVSLLSYFIPKKPTYYPLITQEQITNGMKEIGTIGYFINPVLYANDPLLIEFLLIKNSVDILNKEKFPVKKKGASDQRYVLKGTSNIGYDLGIIATRGIFSNWPSRSFIGYPKFT